MKSLPLSLQDRALLNARNMAETIIGHIKEFSSLNLSKHRSVINAFVHIIAAITAYQINPFKPKRNLQPAISSKPQPENPLSGLTYRVFDKVAHHAAQQRAVAPHRPTAQAVTSSSRPLAAATGGKGGTGLVKQRLDGEVPQ